MKNGIVRRSATFPFPFALQSIAENVSLPGNNCKHSETKRLLGNEYMVFRGNASVKQSSGTLGGGDLYSFRMKLAHSEIQRPRHRRVED
jgi:hypothetical protein